MALVDKTLETAILSVFNSMSSMTSGGDAYCAKNMANAIKTYILTATASSIDSGTVSSTSSYVGEGTGQPGCFVIDNSSLESDLKEVFENQETTDNEIADGIANAVHSACTKSRIISLNTVGVLTPPSPATPIDPYYGTGKGTFSGSKTVISNKLKGISGTKGTFEKMREMTSGGDALFAKDLASAIGDYLRGGRISVVLDLPITGSGLGSVS